MDQLESCENLIGGARRPAVAGVRFAARAGEELLWPRSTSRDVDAALAVLAGAADAWAARARSERDRIVAAATRALAGSADSGGELGRAVGLDPGEVISRLAPKPLALDEADRYEYSDGRGPRSASGEIAIVRGHAAELVEGPARATFSELAQGRAVLLISSGGLPEAAEQVARALLGAGLPPAALALIHDDGESCLGAAVEAGLAASIRVCAARDRIDVLRRRIRRVPLRTSFGVGVAVAAEFATPRLDVPRSASVDVGPAADPVAAARSVARSAFGRLETLGGQRAGRIGMVRVAPRLFSEFSTALLAELELPAERYQLPAWLDPRLPDRLETLRAWGVDEGATLIHEPRGLASRSTSTRDTLLRLVFTNVEPGMRLAQGLEAAPVLLLARAGDASDREARPAPRPTDSESDLEP